MTKANILQILGGMLIVLGAVLLYLNLGAEMAAVRVLAGIGPIIGGGALILLSTRITGGE